MIAHYDKAVLIGIFGSSLRQDRYYGEYRREVVYLYYIRNKNCVNSLVKLEDNSWNILACRG